MKLIFIWGPAASGKLTVARALSAQTGITLFHNHLVVDALLEKFQFGEPEFVRLREAMWMTVFDTAARSGQSLVFTFQPEPTVAAGFADRVRAVIEDAGGEIRFVRLAVSRGEQERRIGSETRKEFRKLTSLELLRALHDDFEASEAAMPAADLLIDTEQASPETAAQRIAAAYDLLAVSALQ
jgi:chloramphenicol 3-O-phosphotransferase